MDCQELFQLSIKGDQQAIKDLFAYAKSLNEDNKLLENWIEKKSLQVRPLPIIVEGMNKKFIFTIVDFEIYHENDPGGKLWPLTSLLNYALDEVDGIDSTEDSTPDYAGATTPSRLVYLMEDYFGIGNSVFLDNLNNSKVRIWADLLAEEVENRFLASKP
jgi:hypothetical protein